MHHTLAPTVEDNSVSPQEKDNSTNYFTFVKYMRRHLLVGRTQWTIIFSTCHHNLTSTASRYIIYTELLSTQGAAILLRALSGLTGDLIVYNLYNLVPQLYFIVCIINECDLSKV